MFDTESGQVALETRSLHCQKGHIALEPGTGEAASVTHSLRGQKEERVTLDTGEFVTYLGK